MLKDMENKKILEEQTDKVAGGIIHWTAQKADKETEAVTLPGDESRRKLLIF